MLKGKAMKWHDGVVGRGMARASYSRRWGAGAEDAEGVQRPTEPWCREGGGQAEGKRVAMSCLRAVVCI